MTGISLLHGSIAGIFPRHEINERDHQLRRECTLASPVLFPTSDSKLIPVMISQLANLPSEGETLEHFDFNHEDHAG
jgi:hypothetical protein